MNTARCTLVYMYTGRNASLSIFAKYVNTYFTWQKRCLKYINQTMDFYAKLNFEFNFVMVVIDDGLF